jgi:phosphohistidine phosphatase SixA
MIRPKDVVCAVGKRGSMNNGQIMRAVWLALIFVLSGITGAAWGQTAQPGASATIVLLVRHAEKAAQWVDDPPLTHDGRRRAEALAAVLKNTHPTAIITTQLRRTVETARPSAAAVGVTPEVAPVSSATTQQNAVEVATAVRKHAGETVLVVGHGNTIPLIIAALGGPKLPDICEAVYDQLFVLVLGKEARLIQSRYGAPGPLPTPDCN